MQSPEKEIGQDDIIGHVEDIEGIDLGDITDPTMESKNEFSMDSNPPALPDPEPTTPYTNPLMNTNTLPSINASTIYVGLRNPLISHGPLISLGEKEADTRRLMASTTKIMTALITVECSDANPPSYCPRAVDMDDEVTVGHYPSIQTSGSHIGLVEGEVLTLRDLLYGMMLPSGNDAAQAIAEFLVNCDGDNASDDDSEGEACQTEFAVIMNTSADMLGLANTSYVNPHGLTKSDYHYSTARDLATLADFAMYEPTFAMVVLTQIHNATSTLPNGTMKNYRFKNGRYTFLRTYPGATGVKGGFTGTAGYINVRTATRLGKSVIAVAMNNDRNDNIRYRQNIELLDWGFGAISSSCGAPSDGVDAYSPGSGVGAGYDNPVESLGNPDGKSASLGDGGSIVIRFEDNGVVDSVGPDIILYEEPGVDERVSVEASVDGINFVSLGEVYGTGGVDLEGSGLSTAHFIRITDQGEDLTGHPSAGYDLDSVRASNWKCPPVANAGADLVTECSSFMGTSVLLDGSGSFDLDTGAADSTPPGFNENIVAFEWFEDFGLAGEALLGVGDTLTTILPLGVHMITLRVTDPWGLTDVDTIVIEVVDTTPPVLTVVASPTTLWPPNHKYVHVTFQVTVEDICDPSPTFVLSSVTSDEPDNGKGDGNSVDDILDAELGTPDTAIQLRAERSGKGDGRTYTVIYMASDESSNTVEATVLILVPHDRGKP